MQQDFNYVMRIEPCWGAVPLVTLSESGQFEVLEPAALRAFYSVSGAQIPVAMKQLLVKWGGVTLKMRVRSTGRKSYQAVEIPFQFYIPAFEAGSL